MPYTIKPGMVEDNVELLTRIDSAIREGEPMLYRCSPHMLSKVQYQLHNLLKATEVLVSEVGGRFSTLRSRVRISANKDGVIFQPKATPSYLTAESAKPLEPDESIALAVLDDFKGDFPRLRFQPSPSFSFTQFKAAVERKGWELMMNKQTGEAVYMTDEDGTLDMVVQRKEKPKRTGFDLLS